MNVDQVQPSDTASAGVIRNAVDVEAVEMHGHYTLECRGPSERDRERFVALRDGIQKIRNSNIVMRFLRRWQAKKMSLALMAIPLELKWAENIDNLVTTVGKNDLLDNYLAGSSYTAAWYMGLISSTSYTTGPAVGDTASSHGGWAEDVAYSNANRPTAAWSAASSGSKSLSSSLTFNINGTTTIKGCFLISNNTKSGTTGILFSAGLFSGGDKSVANGDTLSVSYTASA